MLNKQQQDKLQHLLGDDVLLKVLAQILDEAIDRNKPEIGLLDSNKKVGEKYRAYVQAKGMLNAALQDLVSYKEEKVSREKGWNKAR